MLEFFKDGGWPMFPILGVGVALLYPAARFAVDREPPRLRLVTVLSLALLLVSAMGFVVDLATVLTYWAGWLDHGAPFPDTQRVTIALLGLQESSTTLIMGLGFWGLAMILVAIGLYRAGRRELQAAQA